MELEALDVAAAYGSDKFCTIIGGCRDDISVTRVRGKAMDKIDHFSFGIL